MSAKNGIMMQYFHWYTPADGSLWNDLIKNASKLSEAGFTALWFPPAYKGTSGADEAEEPIHLPEPTTKNNRSFKMLKW